MNVRARTRARTHPRTHTHTNKHARARTYTHIHTRARVHTHTHTHIHTYSHSLTHTLTHSQTHTLVPGSASAHAGHIHPLCICWPICLYACVCAHARARVCVCVCARARARARVYVCVCARASVCLFVLLHTLVLQRLDLLQKENTVLAEQAKSLRHACHVAREWLQQHRACLERHTRGMTSSEPKTPLPEDTSSVETSGK